MTCRSLFAQIRRRSEQQDRQLKNKAGSNEEWFGNQLKFEWKEWAAESEEIEQWIPMEIT